MSPTGVRYLTVLLLALLLACSGGETPPAEPPDSTPETSTRSSFRDEDDEEDEEDDEFAGFPRPRVVEDNETGFGVNSSSVPTARGTQIGAINCFCEPSDAERVQFAQNESPHINWTKTPQGTKSLALIMHDPDAPASRNKANKENVSVGLDDKRTDFVHWVLIDIPPELNEIPAGGDGKGVTRGGKEGGTTEYGRRGLNDYTDWFAKDREMKGDYHGYDGPCPPWNDLRAHRYTFTMYALDVAKLGVRGEFDADEARRAMKRHILAEASFTGVYWINIDVNAPPLK